MLLFLVTAKVRVKGKGQVRGGQMSQCLSTATQVVKQLQQLRVVECRSLIDGLVDAVITSALATRELADRAAAS